MKKVIRFSKLFVLMTIISVALIASGIVGMVVKGINFGIDFKPGMVQEVRVVPTAIEVSYIGAGNIEVQTSVQKIDFVATGLGIENATTSFAYIDYETVEKIVDAMNQVEGVTATAIANKDTVVNDLFGSSNESAQLSSVPYLLFYSPENPTDVNIDEVRDLFADMTDFSIKQVGVSSANTFQIRVGDDGSDSEFSKTLQETIYSTFVSEFGSSNVAVLKTDFVGSQFSKSLASKAVILLLGTLVLILIYSTIRFKWDFAIGAVIAIIHDALIMFAFITWTQMEFTSITLAAILTIIGYSINDTVVVLDRVRENIKTIKVKKFKDILDISQTELLSRTLITTATTLLAVISLFIFTTGSMKDFALALIVGMISGVYSTIFIAGAFIALFRRNWKASDEEKKTQVVSATDLIEDGLES